MQCFFSFLSIQLLSVIKLEDLASFLLSQEWLESASEDDDSDDEDNKQKGATAMEEGDDEDEEDSDMDDDDDDDDDDIGKHRSYFQTMSACLDLSHVDFSIFYFLLTVRSKR